SLISERQIMNKLTALFAHRAAKGNGCGAGAAVAAKYDELFTLKEVGKLWRVGFIEMNILVHSKFQIRDYRMADLGHQATNLGLDVFGRTNVGCDGAGLLRKLIQQTCVHLVAYAEREDTSIGCVFRGYILQDLARIRHTDRRLPVGEEDDGECSA